MKWISCLLNTMLLLYGAAAYGQAWNYPHREPASQNVRYSAISSSPKTLDPAKAYSADEIAILSQIIEPLIQYHYLKRPYQLEPLTAANMPTIKYLDKNSHLLPPSANPSDIAYTVYSIQIKPGIYYQPHPAFVRNEQGEYLYHHLSEKELKKISHLSDFAKTASRELRADDYVYQIKRIASPQENSPIFSVMNDYIVGFFDFNKRIANDLANNPNPGFVDLRKYDLSGVKIIGPYQFEIKIKGLFPQFIYWLAMTFFVPVPWEVAAFYSQPGLQKRNITLNWFPVGTGPYMLIENNPNKQMVMIKNPNFRKEYYPSSGEADDERNGYLQNAGKQVPFIEKIVFVLDKESIPRWNKFLQGYYDKSLIGEDSFDQAIKISSQGTPMLTPSMEKKGIRLQTEIEPGIYYVGFNMLDPVVGGYSEKQQKLRQAISIALDYEEYIGIFLNGRGKVAQGPIPPSIFGYLNGAAAINPYVYQWIKGRPQRRALAEAKQLLKEAGYPNGIDPRTQKPLVLNYDVATSGNPDDGAQLSWFRDQFAKLGIKLDIRATLYNRFQDKVRSGNVQIFSWGWMADYPDPENFLFLLYGPNGKVNSGGENAANYSNPEVDRLFEQIRIMPNGSERQKKINQLLALVRKDAPWIWGFNPIVFTLSHQWNSPTKPNPIARNTLKYERIDGVKRYELQQQWNQAIIWPIILVLLLVAGAVALLVTIYLRKQRRSSINRIRK